jgi:hypothetical protein
MERDTIVKALHDAVEKLLERDIFLLKYDVHECAIAHRIAVYLECSCTGFDVDCEYNNDLDSESGRKKVHYPDGSESGRVRPDIIVHHRGRNGAEDNMLVVELKKCGAGQLEVESDRQKLIGFTSTNGCNHFSYMLGAALTFGVKEDAGKCDVKWYEQGQNTCHETWDVNQSLQQTKQPVTSPRIPGTAS